MSRYPQKRADRGSQKWLQIAVAKQSPELAEPIVARLGLGADCLSWLSPLEDDDFAEYRDEAFLERVGVTLGERPLDSFWPRRGPQWDGLGHTDRGDLILIEAKAHIGEMRSPPSQAREKSLAQIRRALGETRDYLEMPEVGDWTREYYQYTNRLAHLYFLRELNAVPAWLVFVYFTGDDDVGGPATQETWEAAIQDMKSELGLANAHALLPFIIDVFIDVSHL